MRRFAKKPVILKHKIKLAEMLYACQNFVERGRMGGYYWYGEIEIFERKISVYFQRYTKIRSGIDYVHLHWLPERKALTPREIHQLISKLENQ